MVLPLDCYPDDLFLPRVSAGHLLLEVVNGFKACLGVPRHPTSAVSFIIAALEPIASRYDNLMELVTNISEEDPFAALILSQVYGVNRFGHILRCCTS